MGNQTTIDNFFPPTNHKSPDHEHDMTNAQKIWTVRNNDNADAFMTFIFVRQCNWYSLFRHNQ